MDNLIREYNTRVRRRKVLHTILVTADILAIITSLVLFIVFAVQESELMNLFGGLFLALPLISLIIFFVNAFRKDKLREKLYNDVENGNFSAEEILILGDKINVNLFDIALRVRCRELGLSSIPEWCVRDGVLPEHA